MPLVKGGKDYYKAVKSDKPRNPAMAIAFEACRKELKEKLKAQGKAKG